MTARAPSSKALAGRPPRRLKKNLAAGVATSNGGILWELVPVFGSARVKVRIKTASNGGTIELIPVGPDFDPDQASATAFASLTGTPYTTGGPASVAVVAGTESQIFMDLY